MRTTPPSEVTRPREDREEVKPRLRGWIHAGTFPLALAASIVLVVLAPTMAGKVSAAVFGLSACLLFGVSAVYHRGNWSPRTEAVLRRLDHTNIFLIIAGTYTPLAVLLLPRSQGTVLLALCGAARCRVAGPDLLAERAPLGLRAGLPRARLGRRRLHGPVLGHRRSGGRVAHRRGRCRLHGRRDRLRHQEARPNPAWFGFHEIFHVCTVLGFACHVVAIYLANLAI